MRKNDLVFILATLKYPQTILQAAVSWNTEMGKARVRLRAGKNRGYLFEENGHYSPTPELLQAWLAEGVLI
jgi:hypothetical protein